MLCGGSSVAETACRRKSGEAVPEPFAEMIAHDAISRPDQSERKAPLAPGAALIRAGREPLPEAVGLITHRDATRDIPTNPSARLPWPQEPR